jgi:hypothetical protein
MSNTVALGPLTVSAVATITNRGTAAFFAGDPPPSLAMGRYHVRLEAPHRAAVETIADVLAAPKVPPGEVMTLLFRGLSLDDIPVGSVVTIERPV